MAKVSMNEIMGKNSGPKISLKNLHEVLGEKMPRLPKNRVGRMRLVQALKNRFGSGFRNLPGVQEVMSDFDDNIKDQTTLNKMRLIKGE